MGAFTASADAKTVDDIAREVMARLNLMYPTVPHSEIKDKTNRMCRRAIQMALEELCDTVTARTHNGVRLGDLGVPK